MKAHTTGFKNAIKELGRQLRAVITYGNVTLEEEIYAVTPHFEGGILKSIMKQLDLELSVDIPLETVLNCQIGILVNNSYEMLNFGNYVVYKSEKQEDTNTYKLTCYDKMLYSMKQNEELNITYPISIKNYLIAICNKLGLTLETNTFQNESRMIQNELYLGLDYTYRDILDEIAQATGSIICLNENDRVLVKYPTQTDDTIDEEFLKDVNVDFGQMYGAINTIVLSRSGESDNIYYPETLPENPIEIKIKDNQIMNWNDRSDYLPGIYNALNGLYYYINDFSSTGIMYYEVGDLYNVQVGNNTYQCLMLNDEINITTGIEEIIHTDLPEESETDYTKADKTDRRINQTYLIVDKQNQTIESIVTTQTEQNQKIARVVQTVDELNSKISDIADITTSLETNSARLEFEGINQSEPVRVVIHPIGVNISKLYPRTSLKPSSNLTIKTRILRFENTTTDEIFEYELPDDLLYYDSENYDEFILDYDGLSCIVNKKCKWNNDGTVGLLANERTDEYTFPHIELTDGDYTVQLIQYNSGYIFTRMMTKNYYTDQFATRAELNSEISQTVDNINLSVNERLTNYSTTSQMNSAIDLKASEITSSVSNTYATKSELSSSTSSLNSKIDQTAQSISLTVDSVQEQVETAQSTADTATTKANNAQTSANNAQTSANNAQATADNINTNLTTNYYTKTQTNSAINQKADSITSTVSQTYSTKTETTAAKNAAINSANASTDTKLQSYSTTTQMNTAIEQKANQITSTVSQTYSTKTETSNAIDAIEVGARNYFVGTGTLKNLEVNKASGYGTYDPYSTSENKTLLQLGFNVGDEVTISFNWQIAKNGSLAFVYGNCRLEWIQGSTYLAGIKNPAMTFSAGNTAGYVTVTVKLNSTSINANKVRFRVDNSVLILKISNMKVEKGNKATSWTPAPEEYSTTTEMNSAITQTANTIMTSVNQKVGKTEVGTYIEQNTESVKLAWNQISEYIQMMIINNNASFAILDSSKKPIAYFDKTGIHFSSNNTAFGEMGVQTVDGNKFIAFSVDGTYGSAINNGMAWGIKTTTDNKFHPIFYIKNFEMGSQGSDATFGELVLSASNLVLDGIGTGVVTGGIKMFGDPTAGGIYFYDINKSKYLMNIYPGDNSSVGEIEILDDIIFAQNQQGSHTLRIGSGNNYCLLTDEGYISCNTFYISNGGDGTITGSLWVNGNIHCDGNVYAQNVSDRRLKKNIKDVEDNALDNIKKMKVRSFDWKKDDSHVSYGFIAQELEEIDECYVLKQEIKNDKGEITDYKYYQNEFPIIATLTKAIQEQQAQIEELQKEIKELKGGK